MHKFHKRSYKISKTNRKMINKIFIKIENIVGIISNIIFFTKEYFPFDSFALTTTWRMTMMFSWFRRSIEDHKWLILEWTRWMVKNVCSSSFSVYRTCREIWWSFFFCCEAFFSVRSRFWIFFPRFSFLDFFDFWIPFPPPLFERRHLYL